MKVRSGVQIPERSGLPSAALGVRLAGRALSWAVWARAVPPPAGSVGSSWAQAAVAHIAARTALSTITRILYQFDSLAARGLGEKARGTGGIEDAARTEAG